MPLEGQLDSTGQLSTRQHQVLQVPKATDLNACSWYHSSPDSRLRPGQLLLYAFFALTCDDHRLKFCSGHGGLKWKSQTALRPCAAAHSA
jgi:hypothetical protein